jgi:hypothetical protein
VLFIFRYVSEDTILSILLWNFSKTRSVTTLFLKKSLIYFAGDTDEDKSCVKYVYRREEKVVCACSKVFQDGPNNIKTYYSGVISMIV